MSIFFLPYLRIFFWGVAILSVLPAGASGQDLERIVLENGFLKIDFVPALSGRVSGFVAGESDGLIAFQAPNQALRRPPVPEHDPSGGGTLWLSPQADWWRHQRVDADRRRRLPPWPPDPYGERADFRVHRPDPSSLVFTGPSSPVSGVKLEKTVEFLRRDLVEWSWAAQNRTWGIRRWGLWPNFRFEPETEFWIWNPDRESPRWSGKGALPPQVAHQQGRWLVVNGSKTSESGKISLRDWTGRVIFFYRDMAVRVTVPRVAATRVAEGHDPLEIFINAEMGNPSRRCTEFEVHGPRRVLLPGAATRFTQQWLVKKIGDSLSESDREALALSLLEAR
jgi:hypothetical protein